MKSKFIWFILLIGGVTYLTTLYLAAWNFTTDDAYITLRYSRHLFEGHGLLWNIDGPPVEGYSNFLFVILGALAYQLGFVPILFFKTIGIVSLIATNIILYQLSRRWIPALLALFVPFSYSLYLGTIWWSVSGMETAFFVLLIVSATALLCRAVDHASRHYTTILAGLLLALAGLTRPEAPMLWISANIALVWAVKSDWKKWRHIFLLLNLSFAIPYGGYFLWRWWYFSRLFPNSVYCKSFDGQNPFTLVIEYLTLALPFFIAALGFRGKRHGFFWLPSVIYLIIITGANPIIAYLTRHFLAVYALVLVIGFAGLYQLINRLCEENLKLLVSMTSFGLMILLFVPHFSAEKIHDAANRYEKRSELRFRVADFLNFKTDEHDWVAIPDCGIIPYALQANIIDTLCLNSLEMTTTPIDYSMERFSDWLLNTAKPKYIVISYFSPERKEDVLGMTIRSHTSLQTQFLKHYRKIQVDKTLLPLPDYEYDIYERLKHP